MKNIRAILAGIFLAISFGPLMLVEAKSGNSTLAEKVQLSNIILIGDVKELHDDYVTVTVKKVLKGVVPLREIEVSWDKTVNNETMVVQYNVGAQFLIFTSTSDARYHTFMGERGVVKLEKGEIEQYETAINGIEKYNVSKSTEEIKGLLITMLRSNNPLLQDAVLWDYIYIDRGFKRRNFGIGEKELSPDVIRLTKNSDKRIAVGATQALDSIGGIESIPTLIELVGDDDESVARIAARALSTKTRFKKTIERGSPIVERKKVQAEWQEWWGKNKDKVKIRH